MATTYVSMTGLVVCGTMTTLITKLLSVQNVLDAAFDHVFVIAWFLFLGQLLSLIPYMYQRDEKHEQGLINYLTPAALDICGTTQNNFGLLLTSPSVYQMVRGSIVIISAILRVVTLQKPISKQQAISVLIVFAGVTIVGYAGFQQLGSASLFGVLLIIMAQTNQATLNIFEEHFIGVYSTHPLLMSGMEGLYGFSITSVILFVLNSTSCTSSFCKNGKVEDVSLAFSQLTMSGTIQLAVIAYMICCLFANYFAASLISTSGAMHKSMTDTMRVVAVWFVSLSLGWESFSFVQLCGFSLIVAGNALYNRESAKLVKDEKFTV